MALISFCLVNPTPYNMLLPSYKDFAEKNAFFKPSEHYPENKINDIATFDRWYKDFSRPYAHATEKFNFFFRGMKDARYQLFNAAQREWLTQSMAQWGNSSNYLAFIKSLIQEAKTQKIFEKVLQYHQIDYDKEADFPILSILQHYGAPTPLMDWSYNLDVALYFATEEVSTAAASESIDGYLSVYVIKKSSQSGGLRNIFDYSGGQFPSLDVFKKEKFAPGASSNFVCYISDFEMNQQQAPKISSIIPSQQTPRKQRPVTTYYNQNIIPQEGFFIFNPYPDKPLEACFSEASRMQASESYGTSKKKLAPFLCYNIRKDLAEYIRRIIKFKGIDNGYIYPDLKNFAKMAKDRALNSIIDKKPSAAKATAKLKRVPRIKAAK
jgi:FRG domain